MKRTIHVNQAGTLSNLISDSEKYIIEELTLTGELNGTDFRLLRDMGGTNYKGEITSGVLSFLDLTDSKIVAGGEMYLDANSISFSTENGKGVIGNSFHCSIEQNNTIPLAVFAGCKFKSICLPKSVTCIEERAFQCCWALTDIIIPDGVTTIGNQAFSSCRSLSGVNLPESMTDIGSNAFSNCSNLASIRLPDNISQIGSHAFFYCSNLKTIDLPQKLENINVCVFSYCTRLASITIPSNVTWIRDLAFENCSALNTLIISQNLSSISPNAFEGCRKLNDIGVLVTDFSAFCKNRVALAIKSNTGKTIKLIDSNGNTIKDFVIPNDVTNIDSYAFYYCSCLSSVIIPSNVTSIGYASFEGCTGLKTIEIPNSISSINKKAFSGCSGLTSATIGTNVTHIGEDAFEYCQGLASILYTGINPPSNWIATTITYVPCKSSYTNPIYINGASESCIKEMMSFVDKEFIYSGQAPTPQWINHIVGYNYNAEVLFPTLNTNAGFYKAIVPVTFTKGDVSFTAIIPYEYTIKQASLSVKANNSSREYGEENPVFSCSYSGFVNGENENVIKIKPTMSTTANKLSDVGNYPINVNGGEAANYSFIYFPGVLTVTKAPLTVRVNDASRQYGADNPQFTAVYSDLKNGETAPKWSSELKLKTSATKTSDVGEYEITATGVPANYELSSVIPGKLTITQAPLVIKAIDATRKYFEAEPAFDYFCSGFLNDDDKQVLTKAPTLTTEAIRTSNVGKYKITPNNAEVKNYAISYEEGELTITKRPLTATSHCSRFYGEENPLLPIEYNGFVNDETENVIATKPIATTTATKTSSVGEYPITVSGGNAVNYEFVYEPGLLTVTKAPLSAKVNDATKVYGSQNPAFTIDYYGLKNNESTPAWTTSPIFQTDATQSSGVGQYMVKAINGVPINYDLGEITAGTLNITPAQLTLKAKDAVRQYYSDDPNFSYTCNGFVNGDNESVLVTAPKLSTTATRTSNVGTYEITVGNTSSPNYSISYINGTLTVTPRTITASVGNYERRYNEDNPEFEVKYSGFVGEDDEKILLAEPTANTTATRTSDVGTYPIYVTGGIADNYEFIYTSGILNINKAEQQIVWEQDFSNVRIGDQIELLATSTSDLPVTYLNSDENIATIYSAGTKQYLDCFKKGTIVVRAWQEGNNNYLPSVRKSLSISIWPICDVNKDMKVDVADIANVIDVMAGRTNSSVVADADVNHDGKVDVADIATILTEMASQARVTDDVEE